MIHSYTLIRSDRRSIALIIDPIQGLIVRAPSRTSISTIESFIQRKSTWIKKHLEGIDSRGAKKQYSEEEIYSLKKELIMYIMMRIKTIHAQYSLPDITSIKITLSEKRWGSCSGKNGLCFSYRLGEYLDGREEFIDAIIVHELAHLREKNHQKPFWSLVYLMMPMYEDIMKRYRY